MPWSDLPIPTTWTGALSAAFDYSLYPTLISLFKAVQERYLVTGDYTNVWPPTTHVWQRGTVTGLTRNSDGTYTLTIDSGSVDVRPNRWVGWVNTHAPEEPRNYDVAIDDLLDNGRPVGTCETQCLRTSITAQASSTSFTIDGHIIDDMITGKWIPNAGSLIGKDYSFLRRGGTWWHERWFVWPNSQELWINTASTAVIDTGSTNPDEQIAINDPTANFKIGYFNPTKNGGKTFNLMIQGSDGYLHRLNIIDNDAQNLYISPLATPLTVSGGYGIVNNNGKWRFVGTTSANSKCAPHCGHPGLWYSSEGLYDLLFSHDVNDAINLSPAPKTAVTIVGSSTPGACDLQFNIPCFDEDVITLYNDLCTPQGPDHIFNIGIYRTLHMLQVSLEQVCGFYILNQSYNGYAKLAKPPSFTIAMWLKAAAINSFVTSVDSVDGSGINFSGITWPDAVLHGGPNSGFSFPQVYYTILNGDNLPNIAGTVQYPQASESQQVLLTSPTHIAGTFPNVSPGQTLYLSLGFTRQQFLAFMRLYKTSYFVPDFDNVANRYVDPPTTTHPGTWHTVFPSSNYRIPDQYGMVSDGQLPFKIGAYCRYLASNFNDPTIQPTINVTDSNSLVGYYANSYEGLHIPATQKLIDAAKGGTGGSPSYDPTVSHLEDTTKNWYGAPFGQGVLATFSGVATSGTSTTLTDSTVTHGPYNNFVIEINDGLTTPPGGNWYRRPVFNYFGTGSTFTWEEPIPFSVSGKNYRFRFPKYNANRWASRQVQLTLPDKTIHVLTINFSDDTTLYLPANQHFAGFSPGIPPGTIFNIIEYKPGAVFQWQGTGATDSNTPGGNINGWVIPAGIDPRSMAAVGSNVNFQSNQNSNAPDARTNYGHIRKDDYVFTPTMFNELYRGIIALAALMKDTTWTSQGFINADYGEGDGTNDYQNGSTGSVDIARNGYNSDAHPFSNQGRRINEGSAPFAAADSYYNCECYSYSIGRVFAYSQVGGLNTRFSSNVDMYLIAKAPTDPQNADGGTTDTSSSCPSIVEFNDNGDGALLGQWLLFDTVGGNSASRISRRFGSLDEPVQVGPPTPDCANSPSCNIISGYVVTDAFAIVRPDFDFS